MCLSLGPCVCCVSLFVLWVCAISNHQSNSKKIHFVSDLSKLGACCIKQTAKSFWY